VAGWLAVCVCLSGGNRDTEGFGENNKKKKQQTNKQIIYLMVTGQRTKPNGSS
jgi:hypothetical protein